MHAPLTFAELCRAFADAGCRFPDSASVVSLELLEDLDFGDIELHVHVFG